MLLDFAIRRIDEEVLLVDMAFIEQVLLDWVIWQARPVSWNPVWTALCQSVADDNRYKLSNCTALLESEILQTAIRIPMVGVTGLNKEL